MKHIRKLSEKDEKILVIIEEAKDWKMAAIEERKKKERKTRSMKR